MAARGVCYFLATAVKPVDAASKILTESGPMLRWKVYKVSGGLTVVYGNLNVELRSASNGWIRVNHGPSVNILGSSNKTDIHLSPSDPVGTVDFPGLEVLIFPLIEGKWSVALENQKLCAFNSDGNNYVYFTEQGIYVPANR